jgi:hypothetical protein
MKSSTAIYTPGATTASAHVEGSPCHLALSLLEALDHRDEAMAASLFSAGGCFVTPDGTAVSGNTNLRGIFKQMSELGVRLAVESVGYHQAGEVCLVSGRLRYRTNSRSAESVEPVLRPQMVLRQHPVGWRLAIVALWSS